MHRENENWFNRMSRIVGDLKDKLLISARNVLVLLWYSTLTPRDLFEITMTLLLLFPAPILSGFGFGLDIWDSSGGPSR